MNAARLVATLLMVGGLLALLYGGFTYTHDSTQAKLGPIELIVQKKETVNIPMWAGVLAIVVGGAVLLLPGSRRA